MIRLGIRVRARDAEVAFARLEPVLAAGAEEVALGDEVEFAVFEDVPDERLFALAPEIVGITRAEVPTGWATAWHAHLAPVTVGALTIRPPWLPGEGLVVDPGETFGLAAHPTTRLCLSLLQELPRTALVDWGCGCGVLAAAAAHLGFEPVSAIELDPAAVATARANGVDAHVGDVTAGPPLAPTVVANLTLPLLEAAADALASRPTAESGSCAGTSRPAAAPPAVTLVASGVRAAQAHVAATAFARLGFAERERRELDGWAALLLARP